MYMTLYLNKSIILGIIGSYSKFYRTVIASKHRKSVIGAVKKILT